MATNNSEIETGIDTTKGDDETVVSYADDGEHATTFHVRRMNDSTVKVVYYRHEAGLKDYDTSETFDIDKDKTTEQWARECADADPEMAVKVARDYWN